MMEDGDNSQSQWRRVGEGQSHFEEALETDLEMTKRDFDEEV